MMPATNVQERSKPLSYETIVLANMTAPTDVRAYMKLIGFMIMTNNLLATDQAHLVEQIKDWMNFPLRLVPDARLNASLTLDALTALST